MSSAVPPLSIMLLNLLCLRKYGLMSPPNHFLKWYFILLLISVYSFSFGSPFLVFHLTVFMVWLLKCGKRYISSISPMEYLYIFLASSLRYFSLIGLGSPFLHALICITRYDICSFLMSFALSCSTSAGRAPV